MLSYFTQRWLDEWEICHKSIDEMEGDIDEETSFWLVDLGAQAAAFFKDLQKSKHFKELEKEMHEISS